MASIEALIPDDYEEFDNLLNEEYDAWLDSQQDIESFLNGDETKTLGHWIDEEDIPY